MGWLPDQHCTPGTIDISDRTRICLNKELQNAQDSPSPTIAHMQEWAAVLRAYRVTGSGQYVPDLLIPKELGGAATPENLWPLPREARRQKQKTARRALNRVCAGRLALNQIQRRFAQDWIHALN